jgi:hypothetical protein
VISRKLLLLVSVIALLAPADALAAPPVLLLVSHVKRHPAATWTLPPGVTSQLIEVATRPDTASDGYFFTENVNVFDLLEASQTSWLDADQLDPGTYYVHVAGYDEPCFIADRCPVREWSATLPLVIPKNKAPRLLGVRWRTPSGLCRLPVVQGYVALEGQVLRSRALHGHAAHTRRRRRLDENREPV